MSFLAWAFGLGALAVGFPLLFHLIRRTPRGSQPFSSLMFLEASPPRLTRRSRLDEWLLLLLRVAAIVLLALAFMRPFFRQSSVFNLASLPSRSVAILIDTSASMQRDDLWAQAQRQVSDALDELESVDDVALMSFDDSVRTLVDFADSGSEPSNQQHRQNIKQTAAQLSPGWRSSDLAAGLIAAADRLQMRRVELDQDSSLQLILISDLQAGAATQALQNYEWPEGIRVDVRPLKIPSRSNVSARILPEHADADPDTYRVRLTNWPGSTAEQIEVAWGNSTDSNATPATFYVPVGESRIVQLSRNANELAANQLIVQGDQVTFDNQFYTVPIEPLTARVLYIGDQAEDDSSGGLYYLRRALFQTPTRRIEIKQISGDTALVEPIEAFDLVFVDTSVDAELIVWLKPFAAAEGTVFVILNDQPRADSLVDLIGPVQLEDRPRDDDRAQYALLADLDFAHPLLRPFASPQFNDFTKVRFWQWRSAQVDPVQIDVLANFDVGGPALWRTGQSIYCLASHWTPQTSQLALSSKFVMLMNQLLDAAVGGPPQVDNLLVGEPIPIVHAESAVPTTVTSPDGTVTEIAAEQNESTATEQPGIYLVRSGTTTTRFAVNLDATESDISPMPLELLRTLGVAMGTQPTQEEQMQQQVRLNDIEFEQRQKIWKWLLVGAVVFVLGETAWAGRRASRRNTARAEGTD